VPALCASRTVILPRLVSQPFRLALQRSSDVAIQVTQATPASLLNVFDLHGDGFGSWPITLTELEADNIPHAGLDRFHLASGCFEPSPSVLTRWISLDNDTYHLLVIDDLMVRSETRDPRPTRHAALHDQPCSLPPTTDQPSSNQPREGTRMRLEATHFKGLYRLPMTACIPWTSKVGRLSALRGGRHLRDNCHKDVVTVTT
jgi:hypothetical protein